MNYSKLLELAVELAFENHADQRYGNEPYTEHLKNVQNVLIRFGFHPDHKNENYARLSVASWLHDIVEDTEITKEFIEEKFGKEIAELVWCVTNEPSSNREEKLQKTYAKLKQNRYAVILKLADRITNVETSIVSSKYDGGKMLRKYKKEYPQFRQNLFNSSCTESTKMWEYLDKLLSD